jgi:hypothetical protein
MTYPYQFHSWSTQYREEALREANKRHLIEQARTDREPRESGRLGLAWRSLLASLRGTQFSE